VTDHIKGWQSACAASPELVWSFRGRSPHSSHSSFGAWLGRGLWQREWDRPGRQRPGGRGSEGGAGVRCSREHKRRTDSTGRFDFPQVAIGHYTLTISQDDFAPQSESVTVKAGYFSVCRDCVALEARRGDRDGGAADPRRLGHPDHDREQADIESTPGATNANSSAMIIDYVPGAYQAHDMLHMRAGIRRTG